MLEKPIEWRRFERVQLEGDVARTLPRTPSPSPISAAPSLLQEFERVLRENERLHMEVATLRGESTRNAPGTQKYRDELKILRDELGEIEDMDRPVHINQTVAASTESSESVPEKVASEAGENLASIVAGYIFPTPSEQHIRLVTDALKARGIDIG